MLLMPYDMSEGHWILNFFLWIQALILKGERGGAEVFGRCWPETVQWVFKLIGAGSHIRSMSHWGDCESWSQITSTHGEPDPEETQNSLLPWFQNKRWDPQETDRKVARSRARKAGLRLPRRPFSCWRKVRRGRDLRPSLLWVVASERGFTSFPRKYSSIYIYIFFPIEKKKARFSKL